jgi:hypothetical protein
MEITGITGELRQVSARSRHKVNEQLNPHARAILPDVFFLVPDGQVRAVQFG